MLLTYIRETKDKTFNVEKKYGSRKLKKKKKPDKQRKVNNSNRINRDYLQIHDLVLQENMK